MAYDLFSHGFLASVVVPDTWISLAGMGLISNQVVIGCDYEIPATIGPVGIPCYETLL